MTTKCLQIQGKPLYIYNQVIYFLIDYTDLNGFLHIVHKSEDVPNAISIDKNDLEDRLKALLLNAYFKLDNVILEMIRTSYIIKDIALPLNDYSLYVFPSLRALEGIIRSLLFGQGYSVSNKYNSLSQVFEIDFKNNYHSVKNNFKRDYNCDNKLCYALEHCYNYFTKHRHELFHANDVSFTTKTIATQDRASQMIEEIVIIIEEAYSKLSN